MSESYPAEPHIHHKKHKGLSRTKVGIAILSIIIIAIAVEAISGFNSGRVLVINSPRIVNITRLGIAVQLNNSVYLVSFVGGFGSGTAYIILTKLPVFLNPALNITLNQNSTTHVSYDSQYAIVGFELKGFSNRSALVSVVPVSAGLNIPPDSGKIRVVPNFLVFGSSAGGSSTITGTTTIATTVTTTTSSTSTSTIRQLSIQEKVMGVLQKSLYYPLMLNYTTLYANTANCTSTLYNTTYILHNLHAPSGQSTYQNISSIIPYRLSLNITGSSNRYTASYITKSRSSIYNSIPALVIGVNLTSNTITSTQITSSGIFYGASYNSLLSGYRQAVLIGNACGIYVAG